MEKAVERFALFSSAVCWAGDSDERLRRLEAALVQEEMATGDFLGISVSFPVSGGDLYDY